MPKKTKHEKTLDRLARILRSKPMTARAIAEALKCCRPAAYQRVRALQDRGEPVYMLPDPPTPGRPGPRSVAYGIR